MNSDRFDELSRKHARALTRRQALRTASIGAAAAAIAALSPRGGRAQLDGVAECRYEIELHISNGPSAPLKNTVTLDLPISERGAIEGGTFQDANGITAVVVGQATGTALDLLITSTSGTSIALNGVGTEPISSCTARLKGVISGPAPGDIGTWVTAGDAQTSVTAPALGSGQSSTQPPSGGGSSQCTPVECGESFVQDPVSCLCVCSSSTVPCGQNCCPSGSACDQATGTCGCPAGTEQCGTTCVSSCGPDEFLDLDSCTCMSSGGCLAVGQTCAGHGDCCDGYCAGGTCQICGGEVCGDWGCVDTTRDPQHCGGCYAQCFSPSVCNNGFCQS